MGAQVKVKTRGGKIKGGVSAGENEASVVEDGGNCGLLVFEVSEGGGGIRLLSGGEGEVEACVFPGRGDGAAGIGGE